MLNDFENEEKMEYKVWGDKITKRLFMSIFSPQ